MSFLIYAACADMADRVGWTLLHSLWQCAVVAIVLVIILQAMGRRTASARYMVACAGMATMFAGFVVTFFVLPMLDENQASTVAAVGDGQLESGPASTWRKPSPSHRIGPPVATEEELDAAGMGQEDLGDQETVLARSTQPESGVSYPSFSERAASALAPWLPWIATGWLLGVLSLSVWNVGGWFTAERLRLIAISPVGPDIAGRFVKLVDGMKVSRPIRLLRSAVVESPITIGSLRPTILLPLGLITGLTPSELDAIIIHELAHVRRHDYLANLFQTMIETLLFYHPAVWWISRRIRIERENCCDDGAVAFHGDSISYARTLSRFGELRHAGDRRVPVGQVVSADGGSLLARVRRLLPASGDRHAQPRTWLVSVMVLGTMVLLSVVIGYMTSISAVAKNESANDGDRIRWRGVVPMPSKTGSDGASPIEVKAVDASSSVGVSTRCEKLEWKVGDEMPFTFTVSNQGAGWLSFMDWEPDRNGGWGVFRFEVFDEQGQRVPDPLGEEPVAGLADMFGQQVGLKTQASYSKAVAVNRWAMLTKPGTYRVVPICDNLMPGPTGVGGQSDPRSKDRPNALEPLLAATAVPLGARPEAEWQAVPRIWPAPNFINLDVVLPPITITVRPRSDAEMGAYVHDLERQLASTNHRNTRAALIRKLVFTCDRRAVPVLLEEAYRSDTSHYWINEGFLYYLPRDQETTRTLLDTAARRGMSRGMLWVLDRRGCTEKDIKPLIDVSLAAENQHAWADGAAAAKLYPDDRFISRLVALAQQDVDARLPARREAIYALALNRTDQSVAALRQLLEDRNVGTQHEAWGAVRSAWHFRHVTRGRPLLEDDFDPKYRQTY